MLCSVGYTQGCDQKYSNRAVSFTCLDIQGSIVLIMGNLIIQILGLKSD